MIDWKTLITAILSTTFIVGIIEFFLKESYKKLLDKKIEQVKETIRQKGKVHDLQFNTFILLSELVYRSRNSAREIIQMTKQESIDYNYLRELSSRIKTYNDALIEVLYEKRAILTNDIFQYLHELKHVVTSFNHSIDMFQKTKDNKEAQSRLELEFSKIDLIYNNLTELVQNKIKAE
jgi:hypothetical protein